MLELAPPNLPEANLEADDIRMLEEAVNDSQALTMVNQSFYSYEQYRSNNHDRRWTNADGLFTAWVPTKVWEGTNVPRASLPVPLTFYHIETMLPTVLSALFANGNDDWFQVEAPEDADPEAARAQKGVLRYAVEDANVESGRSGKSEIGLAVQNILQYGNGFIHLEYNSNLGIPTPSWLDIRDVYIDPSCATPNIDDSRSIVIRKTIPIEDLDSMRGAGVKIPSRSILAYLSRNAPNTIGDTTKQVQEAVRGVQYSPPEHRHSPVPSQREVEVLIYYTKSRIIWVINRVWVAVNRDNPYGFIPVCSAPCYIYPGRFYALSVPDVLEGYQRYIEDLLNKRLDHLSLTVNPPRAFKRGAYLTPSQQRWYPSATYPVENPDTDIALLTPQGSTDDVYRDIQFIDILSEKTDGLNSMAMGVPRGGNVNRTKGGVQAQLGSSNDRTSYIIDNIEQYMIVPMLYKMQKMIQVHSSDDRLLPVSSPDGQGTAQASNFQAPVRFRMLAASRVRTRQEIGAMFPFITQYLLSGPFMSELGKTGQTVDFGELVQMMQDATGLGRMYRFVRPLTDEEKQAMQQPPPEVQAEQQRAQQDAQVRLQMGQMKAQSEEKKVQGAIQQEIIKKSPTPPDPSEQQSQMMKLAIEQQLAQIKMQVEQQKLEIMRQKAEMDAESARMKIQHEQVLAQLKLVNQQRSAEQEFSLEGLRGQMKAQRTAQDVEMSRVQSQNDLAVNAAKSSQDLQSSREKSKIQNENLRASGRAKAAAGMNKTRASARAKKE